MKPILTITLICAGLSLKAQPHKYVHTFISNYVLSGAGGSKESHVIEFREGRTEEDCDTLLIDNFKILCLHFFSPYFLLWVLYHWMKETTPSYVFSKRVCRKSASMISVSGQLPFLVSIWHPSGCM